MTKSIDSALHKLVEICDGQDAPINLKLEDCKNLYNLISELRLKLSVSQQKLCDYDKFYADIANAVKCIEISGATNV